MEFLWVDFSAAGAEEYFIFYKVFSSSENLEISRKVTFFNPCSVCESATHRANLVARVRTWSRGLKPNIVTSVKNMLIILGLGGGLGVFVRIEYKNIPDQSCWGWEEQEIPKELRETFVTCHDDKLYMTILKIDWWVCRGTRRSLYDSILCSKQERY